MSARAKLPDLELGNRASEPMNAVQTELSRTSTKRARVRAQSISMLRDQLSVCVRGVHMHVCAMCVEAQLHLVMSSISGHLVRPLESFYRLDVTICRSLLVGTCVYHMVPVPIVQIESSQGCTP